MCPRPQAAGFTDDQRAALVDLMGKVLGLQRLARRQLSALATARADVQSAEGRPTGLAELRRRVRSGGAVTAQGVFDAAGLTPLERHVLQERYLARSHKEIALDAAMRRPDGG